MHPDGANRRSRCHLRFVIPMNSTRFDLVTRWRIDAPVDQVWSALTDPASWPRWWPYVLAVQTLRAGGPDGIGAVRRLDWATRLPYHLVIEVEVVESVPEVRLRARSRGQLEGEGLWLLQADGDITEVIYHWQVTLRKRWMRWFAPLLAPVFRWNHVGVMRAGEQGLRSYLGTLPGQATPWPQPGVMPAETVPARTRRMP